MKKTKRLFRFLPFFFFIIMFNENGYATTIEPAINGVNEKLPSVAVNSIAIQGNTLLSDVVLLARVAHLSQGQKTLTELKRVAAEIQQAYRDAGYVGVIAFIPAQEIIDGAILVQVIEGKITRIAVHDNERSSDETILAKIPHLQIGQTLNITKLDRNIQIINDNPAKTLKVILTAGERRGLINADLQVNEERLVRFLAGFDTAGTPGTGDLRANIGVQHANLWNSDHIGTFQFQTSPTQPENVQIYSVGYRIPFYQFFSALDLFYAHSNVDSVSSATPAGPIGFTGRGNVAGFRAHHYLPRLKEYDHRIIFAWDWRQFNNHCSIGELGPAGCGPISSADVTITPVSLAYTGQHMGSRLSWGFNTAISGNVGGSSNHGFSLARPGADKHYFIWRFFGYGSLNLPAGFGLAARVTAQYSPDALVPGEQLGIGGGGSAMGGFVSVRGYREREVVGDFGTFFNLEGLGPNLIQYFNLPKLNQFNLRPLAFFDFGWVGNYDRKQCMVNDTSCALAGVGGGIRLNIGKQFSSRVDVGHALMDGRIKQTGSNRIHLSINFVY